MHTVTVYGSVFVGKFRNESKLISSTILGNWFKESIEIHCKTEGVTTTTTESFNSRKKGSARKVSAGETQTLSK